MFPSDLKIKFAVATARSEREFFESSPLGRWLPTYRFPFVELHVATNNREGLPTIYNRVLATAQNDPAIMVFVHDDVHFCDLYWVDAILNGLQKFQVLGVAGNKRRVPKQCSWAFPDESFVMDGQENLTGALFHGPDYPPRILSFFGPAGQPVKLLDGVLLVAHSRTLIDNDLKFDERFQFHFYDLDFCRQAEARGVSMGTWPFSIIHDSGGDFQSEDWKAGYKAYLEKWGD